MPGFAWRAVRDLAEISNTSAPAAWLHASAFKPGGGGGREVGAGWGLLVLVMLPPTSFPQRLRAAVDDVVVLDS